MPNEPTEASMIAAWNEAVERVKPHMFNLAWQLVDAYESRKWNLLICDDTKARLPALFIQKVFETHGISISLSFIAANKKGREVTSDAVYRAYANELMADTQHPHVLVISESAGEFKTLAYLQSIFEEHSEILDFGVVGVHQHPPAHLGRVYVGGYGVYLAAYATYRAFEAPKLTPEQQSGPKELAFSGTILTGLQEAPSPGKPYVEFDSSPALQRYQLIATGRWMIWRLNIYINHRESSGIDLTLELNFPSSRAG